MQRFARAFPSSGGGGVGGVVRLVNVAAGVQARSLPRFIGGGGGGVLGGYKERQRESPSALFSER